MRQRQRAHPPAGWRQSGTPEHYPLAALIRAETCSEILARLTPHELLMAAARVNGMTDAEIAERFRMHQNGVTRRMIAARRRIERDLPEAARWLRGRRRRSSSRRAKGDAGCRRRAG